MKISGDGRVISHFFKDEKSAVYTILYPPQHSLKERIDYLEDLLLEMKLALKKEKELEEEHKKHMEAGGKLDFGSWLKEKFEKEKSTAEEKAKLEQSKVEEVQEVPVEVL